MPARQMQVGSLWNCRFIQTVVRMASSSACSPSRPRAIAQLWFHRNRGLSRKESARNTGLSARKPPVVGHVGERPVRRKCPDARADKIARRGDGDARGSDFLHRLRFPTQAIWQPPLGIQLVASADGIRVAFRDRSTVNQTRPHQRGYSSVFSMIWKTSSGVASTRHLVTKT